MISRKLIVLLSLAVFSAPAFSANTKKKQENIDLDKQLQLAHADYSGAQYEKCLQDLDVLYKATKQIYKNSGELEHYCKQGLQLQKNSAMVQNQKRMQLQQQQMHATPAPPKSN